MQLYVRVSFSKLPSQQVGARKSFQACLGFLNCPFHWGSLAHWASVRVYTQASGRIQQVDSPEGSIIYTIRVLESSIGALLFGPSRNSGYSYVDFRPPEVAQVVGRNVLTEVCSCFGYRDPMLLETQYCFRTSTVALQRIAWIWWSMEGSEFWVYAPYDLSLVEDSGFGV